MNNSFKVFSVLALLVSLFSCDSNSDDTIVARGELTSRYTFIKEATPGLVTFINTSENSDSFLWDFGDNTTSTLINPVKTYTKTGDYIVKLTTKNNSTGIEKSYSSTISLVIFAGGLVANGNFELGTSPWTLGVANPVESALLVTEAGNTYFSINVGAAGNPFDVNLSQRSINMIQGRTYRLTFDAWSNVNRTVIAGIGLAGDPWTNQTATRNLTSTSQKFSIDLVANFSNVNSRVIFDMGAAVGRVNIDNVTLNLVP